MEGLNGKILRSRSFHAEYVSLPKYFRFNILKENELEFIREQIECLVTEISGQELIEEWSTFVLDYARLQDLEICAEFVKEAAEAGDNVGQDEFENDELFEVLNISEVFALKSIPNENKKTGFKAFISIQPYFGTRTLDSCQTLLAIYYDQKWMNESLSFLTNELSAKDVVYSALVLLGITLVKEIKIGYTDVMLRVCPKIHPHRLRVVQKIGFNFAACIPRGILINGSLEEDFIFFKPILPPRKPRGQGEVIRSIASSFVESEVNQVFLQKPFHNIAILPRLLKAENGSLIRIRNALKSDVDLMYSMFSDAAQESTGYGTNEFPTLSYFKSLIMDSYNVIYELLQSDTLRNDDKIAGGKLIIACSIIRSSWHSRSKNAKIAESSFVVEKKFRDLGFGKEICIYQLLMMKHLGYTSIISDFLESNMKIHRILDKVLKSLNPSTVGFIPRSNFNAEFGWEGQIIQYASLSNPNLELLMRNFSVQPVTYGLFSKL